MDEIELRRFLESAAVDEPTPDDDRATARTRRPTASPRTGERAPTPRLGDEEPDAAA